jgi:hypothetical protein
VAAIFSVISGISVALLEITDNPYIVGPWTPQVEWILIGVFACTLIISGIFQFQVDAGEATPFFDYCVNEAAQIEIQAQDKYLSSEESYRNTKTKSEYIHKIGREMKTYREPDAVAAKYLDIVLWDCLLKKQAQHDISFWCLKGVTPLWELAASSSATPKKIKKLKFNHDKWFGSPALANETNIIDLNVLSEDEFIERYCVTKEEYAALTDGCKTLAVMDVGEYKLEEVTEGDFPNTKIVALLRGKPDITSYGDALGGILSHLLGVGKSFKKQLYWKLFNE